MKTKVKRGGDPKKRRRTAYQRNLKPKGTDLAARLVRTGVFQTTVQSCIVLNAISIGVQTDYEIQHMRQDLPAVFRIIEACFLVVFLVELVARIIAFRAEFFTGIDWRWNAFDSLMVLFQLVEEIANAIAAGAASFIDLGFLRILRMLRLVRIVRLARLLRFVVELRMVIYSLYMSLRSLLWTCLLIVVMIYIVSVYFVLVIADTGRAAQDKNLFEDDPALDHYFGTLFRSCLTLYQSMTGGVDWENCVNPLADASSPLMSVVFSMYIAFSVLALVNVVTGIFVEAAVKYGRESSESELMATITQVFQCSDADGSGMISWDEFNQHVDDPKMTAYFKNLGIDLLDAPALFMLLDADGNGHIEVDEFVTGCLRLRGPARGIDLWTLMYTTRRMLEWWEEQMKKIDEIRVLVQGKQSVDQGMSSGSKVVTSWKQLKGEAQKQRLSRPQISATDVS